MCDKFNKKILDNKEFDRYIIFYSPWCPFCSSAIDLLKENKKNFKGYNIDNIKGGLDKILFCLKKNSDTTKFKEDHKTRPIIFYKGVFIGGFTDLKKHLEVNK